MSDYFKKSIKSLKMNGVDTSRPTSISTLINEHETFNYINEIKSMRNKYLVVTNNQNSDNN